MISSHMAAIGQEGDDVDHCEVLHLPSSEEGAALSVDSSRRPARISHGCAILEKCPDDTNAIADFQSLASTYKFLLDESLHCQFDALLHRA